MSDFFVIRKPAADWTAENPALPANYIGVESSLVNGAEVGTLKAKLFDGVHSWTQLSYWSPAGASGQSPWTGDIDGGGFSLSDVKNVSAGNVAAGFATTATAGASTSLDVNSKGIQEFTGATTQTVVLPDVTTLPQLGFGYLVINGSSGAVTVNSSGGNAVQIMAGSTSARFVCKLLTGTTAASWDVIYAAPIAVGNAITGGGANRVLFEDGSSNLATSANFTFGAAANQLKLVAGNATDVPLVITANASQSGDFIQINSSAGSGGDLMHFTSPTAGRVNIAASGTGGAISFGASNVEAIFGDLLATGVAAISHNNTTAFEVRTNTGAVDLYSDTAHLGVKSGDKFGWSSSATDAGVAQDAAFNRVAPKVTSVTDGTTSATGWLKTAGDKRMTTSPTNATNTLSSGVLTDLTLNVITGEKYSGTFVIIANNSTAGEGLQFDFAGGTGGAFSSVEFGFAAVPPGSGLALGVLTSTALGTALTATTATTADAFYTIHFSGVCNGTGTVIPRFAENSAHTSGTATVKTNSFCFMDDNT